MKFGDFGRWPVLALCCSRRQWRRQARRAIIRAGRSGSWSASPPAAATIFSPALSPTRPRRSLGQTVIVENKPGAGGRLAPEYVLQQPADGYTLFVGPSGAMAVAAAIYPI